MKKLLQSLFILMFVAVTAMAQDRTITGTVTSSDDKLPIPGVSVRVKGTTIGAVTDAGGKYAIRVPSGSTTLDFSFIGYATQSRAISSSLLNVTLVSDSKALNEVVVTAGGLSNTRRSIGTVVTTIKADQLLAAKPTTIASGLLGKVAGLQINGTTGGTNPNFRVVLRGMRSLTGNNEALIVLDNVIVPNAVLGNLNPEDVEDVTVLNGASGAALYGSDASNGALIITTKKGKNGKLEITVGQTLTAEQVAFFPKIQKEFGSGSDNDLRVYLGYENQQYGPAFDGVVREIGLPLANGAIKMVPYSATNAKNDFWETGLTSQTDFSASSGDDRGSIFMSAQYVDVSGTTPKDRFNKANVRINGTRKLADNLVANFATSYTQNRSNKTTQTGTIYDQLLQSPAQVPITELQDWKNDPFANPNGYYNAYYNNPYFMLDNYRENVRNDYFTASSELKYNPVKWLDFTYRLGFQTRNYSNKNYSDKFTFSDYTKGLPETASTYKRTDIVGGVTDGSLYTTRITNEFQAQVKQKFGDFDFGLVLAAVVRQDQSKTLSASVSGLVQPGLFNLSNSTNTPTATEANYKARQQGVYAVLNLAYKNYLFLNATARNDWDSRLLQTNRSFFYPGANLSFVPTDAFKDFFATIPAIDFVKVRAGYAKVGQVNVGGGTSFGAYTLDGTFNQGAGFPYNGQGGFTIGNRLVSPNLTPEFTYTFEAGLDVNLLKNRITATATYYDNISKNQTVTTTVANSSGYSSYLLNAGQTSGKGIEASLNLTPVRNDNWTVTVGGNFNYTKNTVDELVGGIPNINLGGFTGAGTYAVAGRPFPVLQGRSYVRDPQGRIIVNPVTGYPSGTSTFAEYGNASPTKILGLNFTARYKNLTLSAVAEYRGGYFIYNSAGNSFEFNGSGILTTQYNRERFVIPNSSYLLNGQYVANTNVTVRDGGAAYWSIGGPRRNIDENYVTPGDFWKIREITLAYNVPQSILAKSKFIKGARISAQGRNLFIFLPKANVYTDPEYSAGDDLSNGNAVGLTSLNQIPPSRYYGGTISLTF
ncbi:SusC/RagA family TonB-linked outer membrane protein [Pedobacter aquatilis]|uniref:SusC/RagA family TonB-linked outer membrane protein n=1 Tax=Pedobacter aquatilis TaxID=351343 RepID=UPI00293043B7|nr:SusC/RagA family TonB-linked outer membrane protein [Pedobacter aquatilis]